MIRENRYHIPVIAFAGFADSGKTTFLEKTVREIVMRGFRIAYIKHAHDHDIFAPHGAEEKDSERMRDAGCMFSLAISDNAAIYPDGLIPDLYEQIDSIRDADLIFLEGFKKRPFPRVLFTTASDPAAWPFPEEDCICIISDETIHTERPLFRRDEIVRFCDWILNSKGKNL